MYLLCSEALYPALDHLEHCPASLSPGSHFQRALVGKAVLRVSFWKQTTDISNQETYKSLFLGPVTFELHVIS